MGLDRTDDSPSRAGSKLNGIMVPQAEMSIVATTRPGVTSPITVSTVETVTVTGDTVSMSPKPPRELFRTPHIHGKSVCTRFALDGYNKLFLWGNLVPTEGRETPAR